MSRLASSWQVLLALLLAFLLPIFALAELDPYKVLGVTRSSSLNDIRRSYKSLARAYHPDKNGAEDASAKFLEVARSWEILSTPALKADFDRHGTVRTKQEREQEEAQARWQAQARAQQAAYQSQQRGYSYGYYVDPAAMRRSEAYARNMDDDALASSVRLTQGNFDYFLTSTTSQPHVAEGWIILVHSATCEPCQSLHPTWSTFARTIRSQFRSVGGLIRVGRINSEFERGLIQKLSVRFLPAIIAVSLTASGGETRTGMQLHRDNRGALVMPTLDALRDFTTNAIWPTNREGKVAGTGFFGNLQGGFAVPLMDITQGLGASGKDMTLAANSLRARLLRFQSEWNSFPDSRSNDLVSPFVHIYVISSHMNPTPLIKWAAHRFLDRFRFAHISLPMLSHSGTLLRELAKAFPGVDLPSSVSEGALILVQKETNLQHFVPLVSDGSRIEEEYIDAAAFTALLAPHMALHVPRFSGENFDRLCYPSFSSASGVNPPTADARKSPEAHRECFILFAESQAQAHKILLGMFPRNAPSISKATDLTSEAAQAAEEEEYPSIPKHVQLGWMHPGEQSNLIAFFRAAMVKQRTKIAAAATHLPAAGAPLHGVLLRAPESTFAPLPFNALDSPTITRQIANWIVSATAGAAGSPNSAAPVMWIDGRQTNGGLPYPAQSSGVGFGGASQSLMYVLSSPLRWMRALTEVGGGSPSDSGGSSSTFFLAVLFTVVFLLTTSSMLKFIGA